MRSVQLPWDLLLVLFALFFKLPGALTAAFFVSLFSQHRFLQYFLQLCVSAQSQWTYCTLFALTSQSPTGKQWLVSLGPGTVLEWSQTCQAMVLQFHHRLMLPQCLVWWRCVRSRAVYVFMCVCLQVLTRDSLWTFFLTCTECTQINKKSHACNILARKRYVLKTGEAQGGGNTRSHITVGVRGRAADPRKTKTQPIPPTCLWGTFVSRWSSHFDARLSTAYNSLHLNFSQVLCGTWNCSPWLVLADGGRSREEEGETGVIMRLGVCFNPLSTPSQGLLPKRWA